LVVGFLLVHATEFAVPEALGRYLALCLLAGLDSVVAGARAHLEGRFEGTSLLLGFVATSVFALLLAYLGGLIGLNLLLAVVVALGLRLFQNLTVLRAHLVNRFLHGRSPAPDTRAADVL
jgi:small basic protein